MCGIVGVIGTTSKKGEDAVKQLIIVDSIRGFHSTGVVKVNYQGVSSYFKKAVNGIEFFEYKASDSMLSGRAVIAHNRWATKGAVSNENAHPFTYGSIIGVHNGTLRDQSLLPDYKEFPVDSENIYYSFDKIGVENTINLLDGAYALVWHDSKDNTISMIRNEERPLWLAYSKDHKNVFYSSEKESLQWILNRNCISHEDPFLLPEDTLYTYKVPGFNQAIEAPSLRNIKGKQKENKTLLLPKRNHSNDSNVSNINGKKALNQFLGKSFEFLLEGMATSLYGVEYYRLKPVLPINVKGKDLEIRVIDRKYFEDLKEHRRTGGIIRATLAHYADSNRRPNYIVVKADTITLLPKPEEAEEEEEETLYVGFEHEVISKRDWEKATERGCAWCSSPADPLAMNKFISKNEFICPDCAESPDVKNYLTCNS